jgi:hypothetical protein
MSETIANTERCFTCLTTDNAPQIVTIMYDELGSIISLMEWFLTFKHDFTSMSQLYKQLSCVNECLRILLLVDIKFGSSQELLIRMLSKFYNFMLILCKNITQRQVNPEELSLFKVCVDFTAQKMQKPLNQFIRVIQNAKDSKGKQQTQKQKGKEANEPNSSTKILKCAKMIPNLVYLVEQYENQLKLLNKHFKNEIDFTEKFEICLRDFKINLSSINTNEHDDEEENETTISSSNRSTVVDEGTNDSNSTVRSAANSRENSDEEEEDKENEDSD